MFGADMVMIRPLSFFSCICKNPLALHRKRQVDRRRHSFTDRGSAFNLFSNAFDRSIISEKTIGQDLVFANQSQQQVLGFDRYTAELTGLITSKENRSPRSFC